MPSPIPVWNFDADARTLTIGDHRASLTELETAAFAYLEQRRGRVVTRRDLERDVWGLAEGVQSQTTAVTIRNIRKKIGPTGKQLIATVFGVGWRLVDSIHQAKTPRFPTPWFPRPEEQETLTQMFADGWSVITLTGPGGAGKTRLAASFVESLDLPSIFVGLAQAHNDADVERALLTATGMSGADLDALGMALAGKTYVFLLDEAELVVAEVGRILHRLEGHRVVVTSRQALAVPGEAVHRVQPFFGEAGAAFLSMQLRASRWNHRVDEKDVGSLLTWVDGSPLALELIAAHPRHPSELLERLRRGELPGTAMQAALDRSYQRLNSTSRDVLHALALCEAPMTEDIIRDWLGEPGVDGFHSLIDRSLLHRDATGWRLLRTLRSFVRQQPVDFGPHQARLDAWLVQTCQQSERRLFTNPPAAMDELGPLVDDILGAISRLGDSDIVDVLWALYLYSYMRGPLTIQVQAVGLTREHAPHAALGTILAAYSGWDVDRETLIDNLNRANPRDQVRALVIFSLSWLPQETSWIASFAANLVPDPDDDLGELYLRRLKLVFEPDPFTAADQLIEDGADYALLKWMTTHTVARIQALRGQEIQARRRWERLIAELSNQRQSGSLLFAVYGYADTVAAINRTEARDIYRQAGELGVQEGYGNTWAVGRAGLWLALLGDFEGATPFLGHGIRGGHRSTAVACEAFLLGIRVRLGDQEVEVHAARFDFSEVRGTMGDGTNLNALVASWLAFPVVQPTPALPTLAWTLLGHLSTGASHPVDAGIECPRG